MTSLAEIRRMLRSDRGVVFAVRPPGFHHIGAFTTRSLTGIACPHTWLDAFLVQDPNTAWNAAQNIQQGRWPGYPPNPMGTWYASPIGPDFCAAIIAPNKRRSGGFTLDPVARSYRLTSLIDIASRVRKAGGVFFCASLGNDDRAEALALDRARYVYNALGLERSFATEQEAVLSLRGAMTLLLLSDPAMTTWEGDTDITPAIYPPLLHLGLRPGEDPL